MTGRYAHLDGARLKAWRTSKGLSQKDLAQEVERSQGYIGDIESNRTGLSRDLIARLHERTTVNIGWLLTGSGSMDTATSSELDHSKTSPEGESAPKGAPSGTCSDDALGIASSEPFSSEAPLTGAAAGSDVDTARGRWIRVLRDLDDRLGLWGDVIGALSLFLLLFILLFFGGICL